MNPSTERLWPASGRRAPDLSYTPPPSPLDGPHVQTLGARLLRGTAPGLHYRRERIATPDGDFLDLDHHPPVPPDPDAPVVLVLHGLEGSSDSGYARSVCRALAARDMRSVVLNFRGCSGVPNRRPRFYHSGETGDLQLVLEHLSGATNRPVGAVGFSLGGNVLLKYLGEGSGDRVLPRVAAAVSVPFDLAAAADHMAQGAGRFYSAFFLRSLRRKVRRKARLFPDAYDLEGAESASTLREFDDVITAPLHGFRSAADYYRSASSGPLLEQIEAPTLVIHSRDDPFVPEDSLPDLTGLSGRPGTLHAHLTPTGGHVGFLTPDRPPFHTWAEAKAADFLVDRLR